MRVNLRLQVAVVVLALRLAHEDLVEPVLEVRDELLLVDLRLLRRVGAVRALVRRVGGEAVQVEHLDRPRLVLQPELLDLVVRLPDRLLEVVDALLLHHHLPREEIALHLQLGEHLVHLRRGGDIRHPPRARSALEPPTRPRRRSHSRTRGAQLLLQRRWSLRAISLRYECAGIVHRPHRARRPARPPWLRPRLGPPRARALSSSRDGGVWAGALFAHAPESAEGSMRWVLLGAATLAVMDAAAHYSRAVDNLKPDVVYLVTFPGSGNTWIRHLVQQGTQVCTWPGRSSRSTTCGIAAFKGRWQRGEVSDTLGHQIARHGSVQHPSRPLRRRKTRPEDPKLLTSCETKVAINKLHHGWPRVSVVRHPCAAHRRLPPRDVREAPYRERGADGTHKRDGREHTATFQFEATDPDWSAFVDQKIPMLETLRRSVPPRRPQYSADYADVRVLFE